MNQVSLKRGVKYPIIPHSAIYIDMKFSMFVRALLQFISPSDKTSLLTLLEQIIIQDPSRERLITTISVRTALDLTLQVLNFPPGSEIIVTAVNIPDMIKVLRYHNLIVIPVEIDVKNLEPNLEDIRNAYTPNTRAIMTSYLFGSRFDPTKIFEWARDKGLFIFEDEAESFNDSKRFGHPLAHVSMFSFGTIKPLTAFGGAITVVRNNETLYRKMKSLLESYPMLPKSFYLKKFARNIPVILALNNLTVNSIFKKVSNYFDFDYKEKIVSMVRGFSVVNQDFLTTFRKQVPIQMLYLLTLRMHNFDRKQFQNETKKILKGQDYLVNNGVQVPGCGNTDRTFWLFPIIVPNPVLCCKLLNSRGVDAYLGATQLDLVESPIGSIYKYPQQTKDFFTKILYLPIHREVPAEAIDKICKETIEVVSLVHTIEQNNKTSDSSIKKINAKL